MSKKEKTGLGFESMFKQKSSENLLLKAFEIFLPKRGNKENDEKENNKKENNILKCTCSFVTSVLSAFLIGFSSCTVDAMKKYNRYIYYGVYRPFRRHIYRICIFSSINKR
jgi:hypothetical protein